MAGSLRIIRLIAVARCRSAGWAPWLLLAGWLAAASFQEPLMFRRFGIYLLDDAVWVGALLTATALLLAERRLPARAAAAANLVMLAGIALIVSLCSLLLDRSFAAAGLGKRLLAAAHIFASFGPYAICLAAGWGDPTRSRAAGISVVLVSLLASSMIAVAFRSEEGSRAWLASCTAAAAAWVWTGASRRK